MDQQIDLIDRLIKNVTHVIQDSQTQVFQILEQSRKEIHTLTIQLENLTTELEDTSQKINQIEGAMKNSRFQLAYTSLNPKQTSEQYSQSEQILDLEFKSYKEKEQHLSNQKEKLVRQVQYIKKDIERADAFRSQMSIVTEYLSGDLEQAAQILEPFKNRQTLGLKIIQAQEEERRRLSREIHDGPAQSLAHIGLRTEIARRMLVKREYATLEDELHELKVSIHSSLEEIRRIIYNLRPRALDDLDIISTLRKYVQDFQIKTKINTHFEVQGKVTRLDAAMEAAFFRLVQEACTNVMKHAKATRLEVNVHFREKAVVLRIHDNGQGFITDTLDEHHFGLVGMKERIQLLEGTMEIQSIVNKGTEIIFYIPLTTYSGTRKEK